MRHFISSILLLAILTVTTGCRLGATTSSNELSDYEVASRKAAEDNFKYSESEQAKMQGPCRAISGEWVATSDGERIKIYGDGSCWEFVERRTRNIDKFDLVDPFSSSPKFTPPQLKLRPERFSAVKVGRRIEFNYKLGSKSSVIYEANIDVVQGDTSLPAVSYVQAMCERLTGKILFVKAFHEPLDLL